MTPLEFEALGENPTVYYCPYEIGDEEANIYTISNITTHGQWPEVDGYYKDGHNDEFWYDVLFASVDDCLDYISDEDIRINLDGEPIQYSKDELEMMAYEEASGDYHDND